MKTKNKILICILAIILLAGTLLYFVPRMIAPKYKVLEVSTAYDTSYFSGAERTPDIDGIGIDSKWHFPLFNQKTVTIQGEKITFEHASSFKSDYYQDNRSFYETNRELGVHIIFNDSTRQLMGWEDARCKEMKGSEAVKKSSEECLEIARQYLSSYVNDVSSYSVSGGAEDQNGCYTFHFSKKIDGIATKEELRVRVNGYGIVYEHFFRQPGVYDKANVPPEEKLSEIEESIRKKIAEKYDPVSEKYSYECSDLSPTLIRLANGRYALEYEVKVKLIPLQDALKSGMEPYCYIVYIS